MNKEVFSLKDLLIDEYPLIVKPKLAKAFGLNEAIIIQQITYWLTKEKNIIDGVAWTYNSAESWREQFPFWSLNTVIRTLKKLEKKGVIKVGNFNKLKFDRTKWYTLNYDYSVTCTSTQNEQIELTDLGGTIPETNTETNKEKDKGDFSKAKSRAVQEEGFNPIEPTDHEVRAAYNYYFDQYPYKTRSGKHAHLKSSQRTRVLQTIQEFQDEFSLNTGGWKLMIDRHFETEYADCDYNINHFANREILKNRYYETCYYETCY